MQQNDSQFLKDILKRLKTLDYVKPESLPDIDLYMDQVTTFMNSELASTKRHEEDKVLTKTMINNYAKNKLLPPPDKKKYSKEHILSLLFIYYFKGVLSISDIQSILNPITDQYFGGNNRSHIDMQDIYREVFSLEHEEMNHILKDIFKKYQISSKTFENVPDAERKNLKKFAFICMLSFDVYIKRMIIEQTIDQLDSSKPAKNVKPKDKKSHSKTTNSKEK